MWVRMEMSPGRSATRMVFYEDVDLNPPARGRQEDSAAMGFEGRTDRERVLPE